MTQYRDLLINLYGIEIGSVVGCGLDRVGREIESDEIHKAVSFYRTHEQALLAFPIGTRRQAVEEFVQSGFKLPKYLKPNRNQ